jgi:hypothetical protein
MESPSLFESIVRFPGAVIRFPSAAVETLDALNALAERIDRLLTLLEPLQGGMNLAGTGVDVATNGITQAIVGLQQAVGTLDSSLPGFSYSSSALRSLADRLGGVTVEVVPAPDESVPPLGDPSLDEFSTLVTELIELVLSTVGNIPGVRQFLRAAATTSDREDGDRREVS